MVLVVLNDTNCFMVRKNVSYGRWFLIHDILSNVHYYYFIRWCYNVIYIIFHRTWWLIPRIPSRWMFTPIFSVVSSTRLIPGTSPGIEPTKWGDPTNGAKYVFFPKENHQNMIYDYGRTHGFSLVYLFWLWLHLKRNEFKNEHCHEPLDLVLSKNHGCQRRNCLVRLHHLFL